jgi:tellurite resistance protein
MTDQHRALILTMVLVSAADGNMTDAELKTIGDNVKVLQAFRGFDQAKLTGVAQECVQLLGEADGLDVAVARIRDALEPRLRETAFALACDIVLADERTSREELRFLQIIRDGLDIDPLIALAIERGSRARHAKV